MNVASDAEHRLDLLGDHHVALQLQLALHERIARGSSAIALPPRIARTHIFPRRNASRRLDSLDTVGEMLSSIRVDAPPEMVFDFVDDWRNATRYLRRLVRWDPVDRDAPMGVGFVFRVGIEAGPTKLDGKLEVTEYVRPEKISIRSIDGPRVIGGWTFTPAGENATQVSLRASFDLPGGFAGRLVGSFVGRNGQKDLDLSLRDLKRLVESAR
jgi:uncharacterized membrane protein